MEHRAAQQKNRLFSPQFPRQTVCQVKQISSDAHDKDALSELEKNENKFKFQSGWIRDGYDKGKPSSKVRSGN